ncbi:MAG TPA: DMT family transporter [Gemmatimonadaceae bacterium]|nr:DMT family transporter [Gemmatimonadaceae bacterium]
MSGPGGARWRAYAALAGGVACISWSALFTRWTGLPGAASAFWRMAIAAAVLLPLRPVIARGATSPTRRSVMLAALAGAFFAGDLALYNSAIMRTSAANATLLGNSAPFLVALGAWFIFGERPRPMFWGGLALAAAGSVGIVGMDLLRHPALGVGDAMAVGAGACYAAYFLTIGRGRSGMDTVTANAIGAVASVAVLLPVCLALGAPLAGYAPGTWIWLAALGIVCQVGGYFFIAYALGHLPATVTSVSLLTQAPITALLAIPFLGEHLSWWQLLGGLLVLAGVLIVNRAPRAAVETEVPTEWAVE